MSTEEQRLAPLREKIDALDAEMLKVASHPQYFVLSVSAK